MPPRKRGKMPTRGQLRSIVREMGQPPFNARKKTRVSQKKLVARGTRDIAPRSDRPKVTRTYIKKTVKTIAQERAQKADINRQRLQMRLKPPVKRRSAKPQISKPKPIRNYDPGVGIKRYIGIDIRELPNMVKREIITQSEANILIGKATGNRVTFTTSGSRPKQDILGREMNLTPSARARLDAEEARLANEARYSANLQYKESQRNPRVQNPMKEPQARRRAEQEALEGLKAIRKAEKEKARLQKKPLRPKIITPRGGGIPILPGAGGSIPFRMD